MLVVIFLPGGLMDGATRIVNRMSRKKSAGSADNADTPAE